ncbi:T9SS type A sorting domain-containing protein [Algibacter sp.]|nr:T9SS type A sorting domain-containing protein [Algibacter sp.]
MKNILTLAIAICFVFASASANAQCEEVSVLGVHVNPFNMNELILHAFNASESEFFSYPGWRLYDASGVLIAEEEVNFFGFMEHGIHSLNIIEPLDYSVQSFEGTLELWTGFYDVLECTYELEVFPWRVDEAISEPYGCIPVGITIQVSSDEGLSLEISLTDSDAISVLEQTQTLEAGSFVFFLGTTCLEQGQCYYLSIDSGSDSGSIQYLISDAIQDVYFEYVFDEIGEDEILLNPFGQGVCDETPTTLNELEAYSAIIYPNPASDNVTVDLDGFNGVNTTVKLYDSSSKMIFEKQSNTTLMIDVSGVAKGMYSLEIASDEQVLRRQVVIE